MTSTCTYDPFWQISAADLLKLDEKYGQMNGIAAKCPVRLEIRDAFGHSDTTTVTGNVSIGIPGSAIAAIPDGKGGFKLTGLMPLGVIDVKIIGTGTGSFELFTKNVNQSVYTYPPVPISSGASASIVLDNQTTPKPLRTDSGQVYYPSVMGQPMITASAPATAHVTKNFTVTGQLIVGGTNLTALAAQNVTLQRSTTGTVWTTLTKSKTNGTGGYAFSRNESSAGTYYFRTTYDGNATYTNATSNVVQVNVKKPTTLNATVSATIPKIGESFIVKGRLTSNGVAVPLKTVTLQRSLDNKTFSVVTTRLTNGTEWYQFSRNEIVSGTYYYRTKYTGDITYTNATSKVVKVIVTKKPTTFSISTSPAAPKLNVAFTVSGTLKSGTSGLGGLSVHLERRIDTGAWTTVVGTTQNTGTNGLVSVSQKVTTHHTYSYRWHFTGTATYLPSYSPVKTFTV